MKKNMSLSKIVGIGTFWTSLGSILLKSVGFFTVFIILHKLSVYEFGINELIVSALSLFSFFYLPGLSDVVTADVGSEIGKKNISHAKGIIQNFFLLLLCTCVVAWGVLFLGSSFIANTYQVNIGLFLKVISFTFLLAPVRTIYNLFFTSTLRFFEKNAYSFCEEFFKLCFVFCFVYILNWGVLGVMCAITLSQVVALLCFTPRFLSLYKELGTDKPEKIPFLHQLQFHGKWGIFSTYLNTFGKNIRLWVIQFFLGVEAAGLFSLAQSLVNHVMTIVPFSSVIGPVISQYSSDRPRMMRIAIKGAKYQLGLFIVLSVCTYIFFLPVMAWFFPKYTPAFPLFSILIFVVIPNSFASVFTQIFFALKAQKDLFFSIVLKTIYVSVFSLICIPFFGIKGAVYEYILSVLLFTIERYIRIRKTLPGFSIHWKTFFTIDNDDRIILLIVRKYIERYTPFFIRFLNRNNKAVSHES